MSADLWTGAAAWGQLGPGALCGRRGHRVGATLTRWRSATGQAGVAAGELLVDDVEAGLESLFGVVALDESVFDVVFASDELSEVEESAFTVSLPEPDPPERLSVR